MRRAGRRLVRWKGAGNLRDSGNAVTDLNRVGATDNSLVGGGEGVMREG